MIDLFYQVGDVKIAPLWVSTRIPLSAPPHTLLHAALSITVSLYQWSPGTDHLHEVVKTLSQRPQQRLPPLLPHAVQVELERAGREDLPPVGSCWLQADQTVPGKDRDC